MAKALTIHVLHQPRDRASRATSKPSRRSCCQTLRTPYLAAFRPDIEQFLSVEAVAAAQRERPLELPRRKGNSYVALVDPAGGGADGFTVGIDHTEKGSVVVVDLVHGAKGKVAAVQTQLRLLRDLHDRSGSGQPLRVRWDYARKVTGLSDLPVLADLLGRARAGGGGILVASVQRLMAACPVEHRAGMLAELDAAGDLLRVAELDGQRFDRVSGALKHTLAGSGLDLVRLKGGRPGSLTLARRRAQTAPGHHARSVWRRRRDAQPISPNADSNSTPPAGRGMTDGLLGSAGSAGRPWL